MASMITLKCDSNLTNRLTRFPTLKNLAPCRQLSDRDGSIGVSSSNVAYGRSRYECHFPKQFARS